MVNEFITKRLGGNAQVQFHEKIKQNKSKTFTALHSVQVTSAAGQSKTIKAGRDLFKRLFSAAASGRNIDVTNLLSYELSSVPL